MQTLRYSSLRRALLASDTPAGLLVRTADNELLGACVPWTEIGALAATVEAVAASREVDPEVTLADARGEAYVVRHCEPTPDGEEVLIGVYPRDGWQTGAPGSLWAEETIWTELLAAAAARRTAARERTHHAPPHTPFAEQLHRTRAVAR